MLRYWIAKHQASLLGLVTRIECGVKQGYPRARQLERIQQRALREQQKWQWAQAAIASAKLPISAELSEAITQVIAIAHWQDQDKQAIQHAYVDDQLAQHQALFDQLESQPLTASQRRACVIDEHNNLVLAGAGSGKTSVMVGRAAYLLESGQAQPEQLLLLAFGRDAAQELGERISSKLRLTSIKATTFHSLGQHIITQVEGVAPQLSPWEQDPQALQRWLLSQLEQLQQNPSYHQQLQHYLARWRIVEKHPHDFALAQQHQAYLADHQLCSLSGDRVCCFGDLIIANWLFSRGIAFQYRQSTSTQGDTSGGLLADFYLPALGIWLNYFSIDSSYQGPAYLATTDYQAQIDTKLAHYQRQQSPHIHLYYHQLQQGKLTQCLSRALAKLGIAPSAIPEKNWLSAQPTLAQKLLPELTEQFAAQIGLYKLHRLEDPKARAHWLRALSPQNQAAARASLVLLEPIVTRYQAQLEQTRQIDFNDMIIRASHYVDSGQFVSAWRWIMVDEFQDISRPRAKLIKALRDQVNGASLCCVGDDWQAIYRFSGADISYTRDFSDHFGDAHIHCLTTSFRFNNSIGELASQFVQQNPQQLTKQIACLTQVTHNAISMMSRPQLDKHSDSLIAELLASIATSTQSVDATTVKAVTRVLILARFRHQLPATERLRQWQQQWPHVSLHAMTIHASKGMEADIVIITGLVSGRFGLPARQPLPAMLDALLPPAEAYPFAEERRLFYVALTRAKHQVYLLSDSHNPSEFIAELA
nr:UvrD-helicase domain-containing protein [Shewanella sp. NIFS-20-20]